MKISDMTMSSKKPCHALTKVASYQLSPGPPKLHVPDAATASLPLRRGRPIERRSDEPKLFVHLLRHFIKIGYMNADARQSIHLKGLSAEQLRSPAADMLSSVLVGSYIDPELSRSAGCADVLNSTVAHVDPIIKNGVDVLGRVRQNPMKISLMHFPRRRATHEKSFL